MVRGQLTEDFGIPSGREGARWRLPTPPATAALITASGIISRHPVSHRGEGQGDGRETGRGRR